MANLEEYYYKPSVTLLSVIGLWPDESSILRRIQKACVHIGVISTLFLQLLPFITMDYFTIPVWENMPFIIMAMGIVLKYYTFVFHSNDLKEITEQIKHDWSNIKGDDESKIIMHHASVGKLYITVFTKFLYPAMILVLLFQHLPWFLDIVTPLNETRNRQFLCTIETVIDKQKYFHLLALIFDVLYIIGGTVFIATESMYLMWLLHQRSQIEIYTYHIRKAFLEDPVKMHTLDRNARITKIFESALDMYNRAILLDAYLRKFHLSYIILLFVGVASMSVVLCRLSETLETLDNLKNLILYPLIIIAGFGYMYFLFSTMQKVTDSYDNFYVATYDTNWYAAPVGAQKMLLFAMLKNRQAFKTKMYGIFDCSKEGFLLNAKVTFSYFTMLRSIR